MKRLALVAAVLLLTGCAAAEPAPDPRAEVQRAVLEELIPPGVATSAAEGDEAALEFVDGMHGLAEQLTTSIVDDGMCGSAAYVTGLGGSPELEAAHERGCAVAAEHGIE
ncbi:hypothetical protein [Agrococcus sp. TF02-05]|uniref:hypothetical protein n=1 Tax=Agrococcus sp. TF02-05 TaxID=2815211 RepID=UPI001AA0E227|nr:hypothetical protein [Agrococcus sp. TF02-05]MBO1770448.1 hypothetical protein [Agrococcus sp. TF02-05]